MENRMIATYSLYSVMEKCKLETIFSLQILRFTWLSIIYVSLAMAASPAFGAGTIIVSYSGSESPQFIVNGYPTDEIPGTACGFRLEQPGGWDGGWHFAASSPGDIYVAPGLGELSSENYGTVPDGPDQDTAPDLPEYIQMTGPIHPGCDDNLYLFSTPVAQLFGTQEAPAGTSHFVADFWDNDDIVWLGSAGEVIPFPEPLGEEPPEFCEVWPDLCEPNTPGVDQTATDDLLNPFNCSINPFGPGCPPPLDQVRQATGMLTMLGDVAEVAGFYLAKASRAKPINARRMLMVPLEMLDIITKRAPMIGSVVLQIERDPRLVAAGVTVNHLMSSASAASGRTEVEARGCWRTLRATLATFASNDATVVKTTLGRASRRCAALARVTAEARDELMRLESVALPAELKRRVR